MVVQRGSLFCCTVLVQVHTQQELWMPGAEVVVCININTCSNMRPG